MDIFINLKKGQVPRGDAAGGSYLKRVQTGVDKDGSPQYRYLRTQEELEAWEKNNKDDKKSKDKSEPKHDEKLKNKVSKEHKEHVKLLHVTSDDKKKKETTKKSLRIYLDV